MSPGLCECHYFFSQNIFKCSFCFTLPSQILMNVWLEHTHALRIRAALMCREVSDVYPLTVQTTTAASEKREYFFLIAAHGHGIYWIDNVVTFIRVQKPDKSCLVGRILSSSRSKSNRQQYQHVLVHVREGNACDAKLEWKSLLHVLF